MKIVRLNKENQVFFAGLDPLGYLENKFRIPCVVLGAAQEGKDSDVPAGLMITGFYQEMLVVMWLYVEPDFRGQGYGDGLLETAFEMAEHAGCNYVGAYISADYGREYLCPKEEDYLRNHGFDISKKLRNRGGVLLASKMHKNDENIEVQPYDIFEGLIARLDENEANVQADSKEDSFVLESITVSKKEIASNKILNTGDVSEDVVGLGELTIPQLTRGIKQCLKKHPYHGDLDFTVFSADMFDMEISSCILENHEVTGLFLVRKAGDDYCLEYFFGIGQHGSNKQMDMLKRSARKFVEQCSEDAELQIRIFNPETRQLVKKIFDKI